MLEPSEFVGCIEDGSHVVYVRLGDVTEELLDPRYDLANHSPDGFSWGYGGSGPAQLALAMCCAMTDDESAKRMYQDFKWLMLAPLEKNMEFAMPARYVSEWIEDWKKEHPTNA